MGFRTGTLGLCALLIACIISACVPHGGYSDFKPLPASGWAYGDTVRFYPRMSDSVSTGSMIISVCHSTGYIYSNLWLEVTHMSSDSVCLRDTIDMRLADIYGRWQGRGFGATYQCSDTVPGPVSLLRDHNVTIRHIMRVDTVNDIEQIGLTFVTRK